MNPKIAAEGSKGGQATEARRRAQVDAQAAGLSPLTSVKGAKERLALVYSLMLSGLLSGSQGMAATKAIEAWLKSVSLENDVARIRALEKRIAELETELAAAARREGRRA